MSIKTSEDRRRYQHRNRTPISRAFLKECVDKGMSGAEITRELERRTGIRVRADTIRLRLCYFGLRQRVKYNSKRHNFRVIGLPDRAEVVKFDRDEVEIIRRLEIGAMEERMHRDRLERRAKRGDLKALTKLYLRYRIRYPLVEEDLKVQAKKAGQEFILPWLAGGGGNGTPRTVLQKPVSLEVKGNGRDSETPPRAGRSAARPRRRVRLNFDYGRNTGEDHRHLPPPYDATGRRS